MQGVVQKKEFTKKGAAKYQISGVWYYAGRCKVDGLEVLRTIRKDERLKPIPVVILTSSREEKDLMESYKLGVNAYVVKPVDFQQFVEAVKQLGAFWAVINEPPPGSAARTKK